MPPSAAPLRRPSHPGERTSSRATLIADGAPHALSAVAEIQKGLDRQLYAVGLERAQREAILAVLANPPESLAELRGVLARDHRDRST
jgi:hypothetical protein